jgi:hypothetical protein
MFKSKKKKTSFDPVSSIQSQVRDAADQDIGRAWMILRFIPNIITNKGVYASALLSFCSLLRSLMTPCPVDRITKK